MLQAKEFDENIQDEIEKSVAGIRPSDHLKTRIIQDIREEREGYKMKKWQSSIKMLAVIAAAICVIVPTTVIASGKITSLVTKASASPEYSNYSDMAKIEEELGYPVKTVEKFTNGMQFQKMEIGNTAAQDEEGNEVGSYKEIDIQYETEDGIKLTAYAEKPLTTEEEAGEYADSKAMIENISVYYTEDNYKFVPEGYEPTIEEQTAMENREIYISYGSEEDAIELSKVQHANWVEDGVSYTLIANDTNMSADDFFQMAEEIIQQ